MRCPAGQHKDGRMVPPLTGETPFQENSAGSYIAYPNSTTPSTGHSTNQEETQSVRIAAEANQYAPLAEDIIDDVPDNDMDDMDDMNDATNECLADVEERLDNLKIRYTHIQLESIKKNGASGKE